MIFNMYEQAKIVASKSQNPKNAKNPKNLGNIVRLPDLVANYSQFIMAVFIFLTALIPTQTYAQNSDAPIVLELFTSRYCPACPAADRNFSRLTDENPNIIGLSCHVTYFDGSARKDELSKSFCDARQNIYRYSLKTGGIFTPMMVINGEKFMTGIKPEHIQSIKNAEKITTNHPVGFLRNGEYLDISLPQTPLNHSASVWLFEIIKYPKQKGYGHYRGSVTNITKLLEWDGKKLNMAFPIGPYDANKGYALIVHNEYGRVISAAKTDY